MELDWLRTFLAVLDTGGFSAAAGQVHRSQSRVSAHIAALERELGAVLIDRARRPARVTPAGAVLADHAREILAAVGSARSAVGAAGGLADGRLTVLTTPCLASAFLPDVLAEVALAHPAVRVAVVEHGPFDLDRLHADVALAVLPVHPGAVGLRERVLWCEPVRALVPAGHRFAERGTPVPLAELVGEPLVVTAAPGDGVPEVLDLLARRGVPATASATAGSPATVAALVAAGLGVGLLAEVAARAVSGGGAVRAVPLADDGLVRRVGAYWYDVLTGTAPGRDLLETVLTAAAPTGATGVLLDGVRVDDALCPVTGD